MVVADIAIVGPSSEENPPPIDLFQWSRGNVGLKFEISGTSYGLPCFVGRGTE